MKLIVGLGNLGASYQLTRHNIGFMVLDVLSEGDWQKRHSSLIQKMEIKNEKTLLAKPQTQMNLSGRAVQELLHYYSIKLEDLLVAHDDVDLPFLTMKFQKKRGAGGHNGVQNIHDSLGRNDYYRLKIGVGRLPESWDTSRYVLSPFSKEEQKLLQEFMSKTVHAVEDFILHGGEKAASLHNAQNPSE